MEKILDVTAGTPMGEYPARLKLNISGGSLSGTLSIMGHEHPFFGGSLNGEEITLSMTVQTPLGTIPFTANGTLSGNMLDCRAKTRLGYFSLRTKQSSNDTR